MEYILIKTDNLEDFNKKINNKLEQGWKIHGETFTYKIKGVYYHTQALIKNEIKINTPVIKEKTVEEILASWNL